MYDLETEPAFYRVRYSSGPPIHVLACSVEEVLAAAVGAAFDRGQGPELEGVDVLAGGVWMPCSLRSVVPLPA